MATLCSGSSIGPDAPVRILFCASPDHFQHLAVAVTSLARSSPACDLDIHLFTRARDGAGEERLRQSIQKFPRLSLTVHLVEHPEMERLLIDRYWTPDVYLRFLAPEILPAGIDRVLYLDCDLVVLDDIRPLWLTDLKGRAVGAAPDFPWDPDGSGARRREALRIPARSTYVNSGVLLLDLERWRRDGISARLLEFAERRRADLVFPDQDVLNAVLKGDIHLLDSRWNLQARMYRLGRSAFPTEFEATRAARRRPSIVHYTTHDKPWMFRSDAPRKADYFRHLRLTAWGDAVPPVDGRIERLEYRLGRLLLSAGVDYIRVLSRANAALAWLKGRLARDKGRRVLGRARADAAPVSCEDQPTRLAAPARMGAALGTPHVSVIVNNYNYGAYLGDAIESALRQDHPSFEVVVVDDGSVDDSRERIAQFGDRIVPVLQENGGQAAAINAGVRASRGAILCFLDSDDWWSPDKLSRITAAFSADPGVVLAYHRLQPIRAGDTHARRAIPRALCGGDLSPRMLRSAGWWPFPMTSAVAVRRSGWDMAGDIPETFRISADAWLVGIYPFTGRVAAIPRTLGFYRLHDNHWSREVEDPATLARRVAHWEATVRVTNCFLDEHGMTGRLDLADHLPRRIAMARLTGVSAADQIGIALAGLGFPGEPNPLRRCRDTLRTMRALAGVRSDGSKPGVSRGNTAR